MLTSSVRHYYTWPFRISSGYIRVNRRCPRGIGKGLFDLPGFGSKIRSSPGSESRQKIMQNDGVERSGNAPLGRLLASFPRGYHEGAFQT